MMIVPTFISFSLLGSGTGVPPVWHRKMRVPQLLTPHCNFSHPRTYASAIRKKRIVTAI